MTPKHTEMMDLEPSHRHSAPNNANTQSFKMRLRRLDVESMYNGLLWCMSVYLHICILEFGVCPMSQIHPAT